MWNWNQVFAFWKFFENGAIENESPCFNLALCLSSQWRRPHLGKNCLCIFWDERISRWFIDSNGELCFFLEICIIRFGRSSFHNHPNGGYFKHFVCHHNDIHLTAENYGDFSEPIENLPKQLAFFSGYFFHFQIWFT